MKRSHPADFLVERVLHRDGLVLVIDKPAGLPVHARPGGGPKGESLEDYFDALRFGLPRPPALAHRLDQDTTGCLALGRHPKALRRLHRVFSEGRADKTYWAICRGVPSTDQGVVASPLAKINDLSGWRVEIAEDGQSAETAWRLLAALDGLSFVEAKPKTGRTHQIRVHLDSIGCPILGDPKYGDLSAADRTAPMMLHARRLELPLQASKPPIVVVAPAPAAMAELLERMGGGE